MTLKTVLSVSSLVLGIYVITHFLMSSTPAQAPQSHVHIGCYEAQSNLSHSASISSSLKQLNRSAQNKLLPLDFNPTPKDINSKALIAARSFELFFNQYQKQKEEQRHYVELAKAVGRAHQGYLNCTRGLTYGHGFAEKVCAENWFSLRDCSSKLQELKTQLSFTLEEKSQIQGKISSIFEQSSILGNKNKNPSSQAEKWFKGQDRQLELREKSIESNLKILGQRIVSAQYNYAVAQNQTLHSRNLYRQCTEHRKQFRLCQELSQQVRHLGLGTPQSLAVKVQKKRSSILRIQSMLNDDDKSKQKYELYALQNRSIEEYKRLHKIFVQTKAKMNKNCGCSEAEEKKLFAVLEEHRQEEDSLKKEAMSLEARYRDEDIMLQQIRQQRKALFQEFQRKQKQEATNKDDGMEEIETLKTLEIEQRKLKQKSFDFSEKFSLLEGQCDNYRQKLTSYLQTISTTSECLLKRDYFHFLRNDLLEQKKKLNFDWSTKEQFIRVLTAFQI